MTMTPKERALRVLGEIEAYTVDDLSWPLWADLIASAIREAEDAALDRAAVKVAWLSESEDYACDEAARAMSDIRSLKHNKD